jgi:hypothetical protein
MMRFCGGIAFSKLKKQAPEDIKTASFQELEECVD